MAAVQEEGEVRLMGGGRKFLIMLLIAGSVVAIDQATKYLAILLLDGRGVISIAGDTLRLLLAENRGGFLSLGANLPAGARNLVFLLLTTVFLVGFALFTFFDRSASAAVLIASSMIIGGGIGNLIDRLLRGGAVIDFVNMGIGGLRTGIFNFADMAVLFGCILLFVFLLRSGGKKESDGRT